MREGTPTTVIRGHALGHGPRTQGSTASNEEAHAEASQRILSLHFRCVMGPRATPGGVPEDDSGGGARDERDLYHQGRGS